MKEDIIKFRKLCDVLINENGYNKNRIVVESKLSWPTFKKVIEAPIDELKIQASILGFIQDFIRKHSADYNYAGVKHDFVPLEVSTGKLEFEDSQKIKPKKAEQKEDLIEKEKINIKDSNTVQIIVFLKMKATEYRELADDFDKVANSFLNG